jgi:hypothetical protein
MKPIKISKYEWEVLALFGISLIPQLGWLHIGFATCCMIYLYGFTFEMLTGEAWNYNKALDKSTFTLRDRDVSLIFGLGWMAVIFIGTALARYIEAKFSLPTIVCYMLGIGIVGNILERTFLALGLWTYNMKSWIVTIFTGHPIMLGKLPLAVVVGYFTITGVCGYFMVEVLGPRWFGCH